MTTDAKRPIGPTRRAGQPPFPALAAADLFLRCNGTEPGYLVAGTASESSLREQTRQTQRLRAADTGALDGSCDSVVASTSKSVVRFAVVFSVGTRCGSRTDNSQPSLEFCLTFVTPSSLSRFNTPSTCARSDGGAATEERIEDQVSGIGIRLHEELDQRARKRSRVRSLAALGLDLDDIRRPRDPAVSAFQVVRIPASRLPGIMVLPAIGSCPTRTSPEQTAAGRGLRVIWRVVEAVVRPVPDFLRAELDLLVPAEMEDRFPGVLKPISPQPPGTPSSVLRQQSSSTNRQPHCST